MNFFPHPLDGRSTRKPTNIMMYEWVEEKHAYVYLTEVPLLEGLGTKALMVGQKTYKTALIKVVKHEKVCSHNQQVFIPFPFNTFGSQASEVVDLLHRVQKIIHSNIRSPKSINIVFTVIGYLFVFHSCVIFIRSTN